jgi:glycosyltransferase involved in cell wall biosynthesis
VRDASPWIRASLASLWRQTFSDFEVVAVDDGSTDGSGEWLERAALTEPRLRVIRTPPRGLPAALALALTRAHAPVIDSPLAHGSAMLRRRALVDAGGWQEHGWAEDLDLWVRMFASGARFAKLPRALYAWRQHARSATHRDPRYRRERFIALRRDALERGLLRHTPRLTLIGVGRSLEEWRATLGELRREIITLEVGRQVPAVLVFGAAPARRRWRDALSAVGLEELSDFVFVA